MTKNIKKIEHNERIYAIIVRDEYSSTGIEFFTPDCFSQQLGYMNRPEGYEIEPHQHKEISREIARTQEVLVVRSGRVLSTIYNGESVVERVELKTGDTILLADGGHSFQMIEDSELLEIKQGPYMGEDDKSGLAGEKHDDSC